MADCGCCQYGRPVPPTGSLAHGKSEFWRPIATRCTATVCFRELGTEILPAGMRREADEVIGFRQWQPNASVRPKRSIRNVAYGPPHSTAAKALLPSPIASAIIPPILSAASSRCPSSRCAYRDVVASLTCPSSLPIIGSVSDCDAAWLAKLRFDPSASSGIRRVWGPEWGPRRDVALKEWRSFAACALLLASPYLHTSASLALEPGLDCPRLRLGRLRSCAAPAPLTRSSPHTAMLSISRALPIRAATSRRVGRSLSAATGVSVSASRNSA